MGDSAFFLALVGLGLVLFLHPIILNSLPVKSHLLGIDNHVPFELEFLKSLGPEGRAVSLSSQPGGPKQRRPGKPRRLHCNMLGDPGDFQSFPFLSVQNSQLFLPYRAGRGCGEGVAGKCLPWGLAPWKGLEKAVNLQSRNTLCLEREEDNTKFVNLLDLHIRVRVSNLMTVTGN